MADNDIIRHNDLAESGAVKPLTDEFIALLKVLTDVDGKVVQLAKDLKVTLSSTTADSSEGIRRSTKAYDDANKVLDLRQKTLKEMKLVEAKLVESMEPLTREVVKHRLELERVNAENKKLAKEQSTTTGEYEKASLKLIRLRKTWKDLAIVNKENTIEAKALKKELDALDATLKKVDADSGQHQRNVGNYAGSFNGLSNSINQISRELPAFTNSVQTGLMGISNNIPILVDQINLLKRTNAELVANGQKAIPVWKQLGSAIFSWNTLISLAITGLTVFGPKLWEWTKSIFSHTDALDLNEKAQKRLTETQDKAARSAVEENVKLTILLRTAKDVTISIHERKRAVDELQKTYPNYFANLKDEEILAGNTAKAEYELRNAILAKAKVQAASAAITENETKKFDVQKQLDTAKGELEAAQVRFDAANKRLMADRTGSESIIFLQQSAKSQLESAKREVNALQNDIETINAENERLLDDIVKNQGKVLTLEQSPEKAKKVKEAKEKNFESEKKYQEKLRNEMWEEERLALLNQEKEKLKLINPNYQEKELREWLDKRRKMEALAEKQRIEAIQQSISILDKAAKSENQIQQRKIDTELENSKRRQDELRQLAVRGSLDAGKSLAFEERKQAELEQKRLRTLKNQKRQELLFAGLKAYSANVEKNPQTALGTTLKDLTVLSSSLAAIPGFIEGTENVAESLGKPHLPGKDGYIVRVDGDERILNPKGNKKLKDEIGNITNDQLIDLAIMGSKSVLPNIPVVMHYDDDRQVRKLEDVGKKIENLTNVIENRPVKDFQVNEMTKLVHLITETKYKTETTKKRIL